MSNNTISDAADELAELRQRGAGQLAQLRAEHEARCAELARIDAEEGARLERAERAFAADLEAQQRAVTLQETRKTVAELQQHHDENTTTANTAVDHCDEQINQAADAYATAIRAEYARLVSGGQLRDTIHDRLHSLDRTVEPPVAPARLLGRDYALIRQIAEQRHPELRDEVRRLEQFRIKERSIVAQHGVTSELWR